MHLALSVRRSFTLPLVGAIAATAVLAGPAPARAQAIPARAAAAPVTHEENPRSWKAQDASVDAAPSEVVADAAPQARAKTPLGVVTVRNDGGAPEVTVELVRGRAAATAAVSEAQEVDGVLAVTIDTRMHAMAATPRLATLSNDTHRSSQWGLDRLEAEQTWAQASGSGAVVAVIDTGVDATHPDLEGQLTAGRNFLRDGGSERVDTNGHGTHVAGIIAATRGNGIGIVGFAPSARIMPLRVLDAKGSGNTSDIAAAVIHAADHGADVINLSLGGTTASSALETAVNYALSRGVIVLAAVGNARAEGNPTSYPAAFPGVIGVASTERDDTSSSFSNTGDYVDVAAPGGKILSTYGGSYAYMSGTSMATPFVAATAALVVGATGGSVTPGSFERALTGTVTDLGARGWDAEFGHGLVDPTAAVCSLVTCGGAEAQPKSPVTSVRDLALTFTNSGGKARPRQRRPVKIRLVDASAGDPVAGQRVKVVGRSKGRVVLRRWVTTSDAGTATTSVRLKRTTRFVLRAPATPTTATAKSEGSITWKVRRRR